MLTVLILIFAVTYLAMVAIGQLTLPSRPAAPGRLGA